MTPIFSIGFSHDSRIDASPVINLPYKMQSELCSSTFKGVLLGVAEVRIPLKKLTKKELQRVSTICYQKLLDIEVEGATPEEKNLKCFGVVDSFYALQEVSITVSGDICQLSNRNEVILELELSHLIIAMPVANCLDRLIIISRTQNFGRTAVILQMQSEQIVKDILKIYLSNQNVQSCEIAEDYGTGFKRGAGSFGKAKLKVASMFSAISNQSSDRWKPVSSPSTPSSLSEDEDEEQHESDIEEKVEDKVSAAHASVLLELSEKLNLEKVSMSPLEAELKYFKNSEESFVHILQYVEDIKMAIGSINDLGIKREYVMEIFLHLADLLSLHKDFLNALNQMSDNTVKEIVLIFANFSRRFEFYADYIGHALAVDYLFNLHLELFQANYPQLGEYLRKPRMRLNYYVQVLESVKRSSNEIEKELIKLEIEKMKIILKNGNSKLIVATIHNSPFNLLDHGNVTLHGELFLRRGNHLPRRKYQAFLFQDLLTLAKGSPDYCDYVTSFRIQDMEILFRQRGVLIHLKALGGEKSIKITFKAKSIKLQQKWLEALQNQIDIVNRSSSKLGVTQTSHCSTTVQTGGLFNPKSTELFEKGPISKLLPPLTMTSAFRNLHFSSTFLNSLDSVFKQLWESEKTLVRSLRNILCRNVQSGTGSSRSLAGLHSELQEMYHLHNDYLLPVLSTSNKKVQVNFVSQKILSKQNDFHRLYEKFLFMAIVFNYEFEKSELSETLNCVADNFTIYIHTFQNIIVTMATEYGRKLVAMLTDIENKVSLSLKRKYIQKFPAHFSESVLQEGSLCRISGFSEHVLHLILSETQLHFIACDNHCYVHEQSIEAHHLKCSSNGHNLFEVKFVSSGIDKIKYRFATTTEEDKNKWLDSFKKFTLQQKKSKSSDKYHSKFKADTTSNILFAVTTPINLTNSPENPYPVSEL